MPTHELQPGWTGQLQMTESCELAFVQITRRAVRAGCDLHLADLSPVTLSVSARVAGRIGHLTTGAFLDLWQSCVGITPLARQRLAVLSLLEPGSRLFGDSLVRVSEPRIFGSGLAYHMDVLEGAVPESTGAAVLLIHPAGTALDALRTHP